MRPHALGRLRLAPEQLALYCGTHVFVANRYGLMETGVDGFYHHQTRFLSRFGLAVSGTAVKPVCAVTTDHKSGTAFFIAPSPLGARSGPPDEDPADHGGEIAANAIEIHASIYAGGGAHLDVTLTNHGLSPLTVPLSFSLAADFADLDEVLTGKRSQTAPVRRRWNAATRTLALRYEHPRLDHATLIRFDGPARFDDRDDTVTAEVTLPPQEDVCLTLDLALLFLGKPVEPWFERGGVATEHHPDPEHAERWKRDAATLTCDSPDVQRAWDRAVSDLASLHRLEGTGEELYTPMAGIPKYSALFGRDTLVAGLQSALLTPSTLGGALRSLKPWTATTTDDAEDAQPGKVLHQHQLSPLSILGKNPFLHYYGDASAPALFILGAATHFAHTGDREAFAHVRDAVFATLDWIDRDGDIDGDGLYEYQTRAGKNGIKNQGWKDSGQAILHADGRYVEDPIAVAEIQGLYYAAKQALAGVLTCLGERDRAAELMGEAATLKKRFNEAFWLEDERYFALGLGPDNEPLRSISSDPGSCLAYGIVDADKAAAVCERLMSPELFSGWGIRTLSSRHPAYNPLAYHLGSVWPVSSGIICFGLQRHGFTEASHQLAEALFDATGLFDYDRLPEVFGGHPRDPKHPHPGIYPDACSPQAWSATAIMHAVRALCGLFPLAPLDVLAVDPALPNWLPRLTLRNLQVGQRRLDIALERQADGTTAYEILAGGDGLTVIRRPSLPAGQDRIAHLFATLAQSGPLG